LNEQRSVRWSLRNWSNRWWQLSFWSISIQSEKLFWNWTSWTMLTTKYCLNMMMKTFYIQWSFIIRTWFLQNATTRFTTKSFWLLFDVWSINASNWNVLIFWSRSSSITWIWSTSWSLRNWSDDRLNELRSYLNITSRSYINQKSRIWKQTCWSEYQMLNQLNQMMIESYISIRCYCQQAHLNCNQ